MTENRNIPPRADFLVKNGGSVWTFEARTERALAWMRERLYTEPWQWIGNQTIGVDHRPARDLVQFVLDAGLTLEDEHGNQPTRRTP